MPVLSQIEREEGTMAATQTASWVVGRIASALDAAIDGKTGEPIPLDEAKPAGRK
jgi:hypothetical protein